MIKTIIKWLTFFKHDYEKKGEIRKFGSSLQYDEGDLLGEVLVCKKCLKRKVRRV